MARSATILPSFVGLRFEIHNGKIYNSVQITEDMVGHKLGEFSQYVAIDGFFLTEGRSTDNLQNTKGYLAEGAVEVMRCTATVISMCQY